MTPRKTVRGSEPPAPATLRTVVSGNKYTKPGRVRTHFDLDRDLNRKLKIYAVMQGTTMTDVIHRALEAFLDPKKSK